MFSTISHRYLPCIRWIEIEVFRAGTPCHPRPSAAKASQPTFEFGLPPWRIDILVDVTLHMARNRLLVFARKPVPMQVTFAGYPGTTGLKTIDYRITDPYLDPPGLDDACYAEEYVRIVAELARDLARLSDLRATLRARMQASPLMDAPRFARNIEAACRQMWRRWCAGG